MEGNACDSQLAALASQGHHNDAGYKILTRRYQTGLIHYSNSLSIVASLHLYDIKIVGLTSRLLCIAIRVKK